MRIQSLIRKGIVYVIGSLKCSNNSKAIFYHDIHSDTKYTKMSTSVTLFEQHVQLISKMGYEIVHDITKDKGQIEISFDDGFLGLMDHIRLINKWNIPIRVFVISSYLGKKNHINKMQLQELASNPLFSIGSHTHTHSRLDEINSQEIRDELCISKSILEDVIGQEINTLCYPEGKFNTRIIEIAQELGYRKQYTSIPSSFKDELFNNVKGRSLVQSASNCELKSILKGGDNVLKSWYKIQHFKL